MERDKTRWKQRKLRRVFSTGIIDSAPNRLERDIQNKRRQYGITRCMQLWYLTVLSGNIYVTDRVYYRILYYLIVAQNISMNQCNSTWIVLTVGSGGRPYLYRFRWTCSKPTNSVWETGSMMRYWQGYWGAPHSASQIYSQGNPLENLRLRISAHRDSCEHRRLSTPNELGNLVSTDLSNSRILTHDTGHTVVCDNLSLQVTLLSRSLALGHCFTTDHPRGAPITTLFTNSLFFSLFSRQCSS